MKCPHHRKEIVGPCMWCGKKLCQPCIAQKRGNKLYCSKCFGLKAGVRVEHLPHMPRAPPPPNGRRFRFKDGILVAEGK